MSDLDLTCRLILAVVYSGLIGYERELHGRAAGLRTHMLVCLGSTLIMLTGIHLAEVYQGQTMLDPARLGAQVVSGIGFLGAGTILRFRASVRGLTTAASLWAVAGLGLAIGSGFYAGAGVFTVLMLVVLFAVSKIERSMIRKDWYMRLVVEGRGGPDELALIRQALTLRQAEIRDVEVAHIPERGIQLELSVKLLQRQDSDTILTDVMQIDGVQRARWVES